MTPFAGEPDRRRVAASPGARTPPERCCPLRIPSTPQRRRRRLGPGGSERSPGLRGTGWEEYRMATGFHDGSRSLQDRFDTRRLADRIDGLVVSETIGDRDRRFIEDRDMFFLATADAEGRPTCSYKGGLPGFVRVLDQYTLAFPNYDGNGMYVSAGNILV